MWRVEFREKFQSEWKYEFFQEIWQAWQFMEHLNPDAYEWFEPEFVVAGGS